MRYLVLQLVSGQINPNLALYLVADFFGTPQQNPLLHGFSPSVFRLVADPWLGESGAVAWEGVVF